MNQITTTTNATLPAWMAGIAGALPDAIASAKTIIEAGFAPKDCKGPQSIVVAVAMGARLGLDPFTAIYGIAVVNGRPSLYGDALLAVCMNHPQWEDFSETWEGKKYDGDFTAKCVVKRKGRLPFCVDFCVDDAIQAGLWKKSGPWTNTPQRMLMMRARAFALRGAFADALAGFYSREEMEDSQLVDVTATSTVHDGPKQGKARTIRVPIAQAEEVKTEVETVTAQDSEPVVVLGAEIEPEKKLITYPELQTQVAALWKTAQGKEIVKTQMKVWKIEAIKELAEMEPEEMQRFSDKLAEVVAIQTKLHGDLK